jgi:predicted dinucleotide-utilizing enzyme
MQSIGIVGCGAIGKSILRAVDDGRLKVPVAGVTSRTEETAREFLSTLTTPVQYLSREELLDRADLLIETAGRASTSSRTWRAMPSLQARTSW